MPTLSLTRCLGAIETMHPTAIPEGYALSAINVDLSATEFLRPRAGTSTVDLTSGPAAEITYLFADNTNGRLWAFVSATGTGYYWNGSSWSSTSLGADFQSADTPHCVAYNGKVFMGFNGSVNRLHVYDGSNVRRVGLTASAAATVANTGAGAYAATLRYYKIQFRIYSAVTGVTSATSELSAEVSFTPSGAGTAARVTKPTTVDSATHWCVYGSSNGTTYYNISGLIAVGTTTYDDATDPVAYSGGVIAPEGGLFVPPPSAKFLVTNGERLFMAGSYETSAGSGETTPSTRRVWFTRPLGATDAGDDESITQTTDSRYYLDIDNDDGSVITGLASTLDGSIYAFTDTSVWRLVDTGSVDKPIRAERVVAGSGAISQYLITTSSSRTAPAVYFMSHDGPYRYSPGSGAEFIGADWVSNELSSSYRTAAEFGCAGFDAQSRRVLFGATVLPRARAFMPELASVIGGSIRGGWSFLQFGYTGGSSVIKSMATFRGKTYFGGSYVSGVSVPLLAYMDPTKTVDGSSAFQCYIKTGDVVVDPVRNVTLREPYVVKGSGVGGTLHYASELSQNVANDTIPTTSGRVKIEGLELADMPSFNLLATITTFVAMSSSLNRQESIAAVHVPYKVQEPG